MRTLFATVAMLVTLLGAITGVSCSGSAHSLGTIAVRYDGGTLHIEVARAPAEIELGLGNRDSMAHDSGMLFDLSATERPQFWMKRMRFPLDFIWILDDQRVAEVTPDVEPQPGATDDQLRLYSPMTDVRYVLELNAGAAGRLGIEPGSQLTFDVGS